MMKILLATRSVTPNSGVPSYNRELCSLLSKEHRIDLLVGEKLLSYPGYQKIYSTAGMRLEAYADCRTVLQWINKGGYDLIINSNSEFAAILTPFFDNKVKVISISHSLGTVDCVNAVFNHRYIDTVVVLSQSCKDYIANKYSLKNDDKVKVVFNSVASAPNAAELRENKKSRTKLSIVFAGGSAPSKSPDIVYRVIRRLCETDRDFSFYWLGAKTPPLKRFQPYDNIATLLPEDPRIKIMGRIAYAESSKIIADSNIFFAPSRREGFPMALLEAMRIGCIPIVSDYRIANREIIQDGVNGFVISHKNIEAFSSRIIDIMDNHQQYAGIYDSCYSTFVDILSFDHWHKRLSEIFSSKLKLHRNRLTFNRRSYMYSLVRYKLAARASFAENMFKEIIPCAIRFRDYYRLRQHNKRNT